MEYKLITELIVHECMILVIENYNKIPSIPKEDFEYIYNIKFKQFFMFSMTPTTTVILNIYANNLQNCLVNFNFDNLSLDVLSDKIAQFIRYQFININSEKLFLVKNN